MAALFAAWTPRSSLSDLSKTALIGFLLGAVATVGLGLVFCYCCDFCSLWGLSVGLYLIGPVAYFHMAEFLVAAQFRAHDASPRSFMLFHSTPYLIAQAAAWCEFLLEVFFVPPEAKLVVLLRPSVVLAGFVGVALFYNIRVIAMSQCADNFSLEIEVEKRKEHMLISHGLYRYLRHPAYFGWFYHAISSQIILGNPIACVGFAVVTWKFFAARIPYEEALLASSSFFGREYEEYRRTTAVGIPFIS